MRERLVFDHIFPIDGPASAKLMRLKADCLLRAGVINVVERDLVYVRSAAAVGGGELLEPDRAAAELLPAIALEPSAPAAAVSRL